MITVERGSSGTIAATHSAGATVTIGNRWAWTSFGNLGGNGTQIVELVTSAPHLLKAGQTIDWNGTFPTMVMTDSRDLSLTTAPIWPTGPSSFVMLLYLDGGTLQATLSTTYTLNPSTNTYTNSLPPAGPPYEYTGILTSQIGCNHHTCLPMLASDSYVYAVANKLLANITPGRRVYVELADEPWNNDIITTQTSLFGSFNGFGQS